MEEQTNTEENQIFLQVQMDTDDQEHSIMKEEHLYESEMLEIEKMDKKSAKDDIEVLEIEKMDKKNIKKRVSLTIEKKIEIINRYENGEAQKVLSQEYNVGRTTISDILKRKYKFLKFMAENTDNKSENLKRRRTLRRTVHKLLEDKLLEWYNENRHMYISGPMIANKAQELHKELGYTDSFSASNGWLDRFKSRHGIKLCGLRELKVESDVNAVGPFRSEIESLAQWYNLSLEQIYNADETDLFFKMMPNPESDSNEVKSSVRAYRERMTVLCCANATGSHKLPLACIGRGKKSRTFTANESKNLTVVYFSQETAWMSSEIFTEWFHHHFVPSVREHLRGQGLAESALLLIDRNSSHPSDQHLRSDDNCFFVQYFNSKVKSLVQPMEQGIVSDMKLLYRYNLLTELIDSKKSTNEFHKMWSIKDAIKIISGAWISISPVTVQQCFSKIFPLDENNTVAQHEPILTTDEFMELVRKIPELVKSNSYTKERLEYWLRCDDAEPKRNQGMLDTTNTSMTNDDESEKYFDTYQDEMQQSIEIIDTTEHLPQHNNSTTILVQEYIEEDEMEDQKVDNSQLIESQHEVVLSQADIDASEDNILYEEVECDITCKDALKSLDVVLKFMKNDNESRYRDVVFLSELKKRLQKRLIETEAS
jgi:Mor family transcriptional regulator